MIMISREPLEEGKNPNERPFASIGVLFDLDDTLVLTSELEHFRRARDWKQCLANLCNTLVPEYTAEFLKEICTLTDRIGIVTSSPRHYAEAVVRYHGLGLPVLVAYHDTAIHKPHPAPLLLAAQKLGVAPISCMHIGDSEKDFQAATSANMIPIQVLHKSAIAIDIPTCHVCTNWTQVIAEVRRIMNASHVRSE
jgi:HAD superfamily hydrolase (TIGR01549 family)